MADIARRTTPERREDKRTPSAGEE